MKGGFDMTETKGSKSLLVPLLAGVLGAGLALLFAPRSGKETREKIRTKADDMKHQAEDSMANVRESLDQSIQEAQDIKKRISEAMRQTGRKAKQEMKDLREDQEKRLTPMESSVLSTWEEEV